MHGCDDATDGEWGHRRYVVVLEHVPAQMVNLAVNCEDKHFLKVL